MKGKLVIETTKLEPEPEIRLNIVSALNGSFQLCGRLNGTQNWIIADIRSDGRVSLNPAGCEQLGLKRT